MVPQLRQSGTPRNEALVQERLQPRALRALTEIKSSRLKPLPQKTIPWTGWHRCLGRPGDPGRALAPGLAQEAQARSEKHTSALQSLMSTTYAVFCLKKKTK